MNLRYSVLMAVYLAILAIVALFAFVVGFAKQSFIADRVVVVNEKLRAQLLTDVTEQVSKFCQPMTLSDGTPLKEEEIDPKAWQTITDINSRLAVVQHSQARLEQACRAISEDQIIQLSALLNEVKTDVNTVGDSLNAAIDHVTIPCTAGDDCARIGIGQHLVDVPADLQSVAQELSGDGEGPLSNIERQINQLDEVMSQGDQLVEKGEQVIQASWSQMSRVQTRLLEILPEQMSFDFRAKEHKPAIVIEFARPFTTDCSTINLLILPEPESDDPSEDYQSAIFAENVRDIGGKFCQVSLQGLLDKEEFMALFELEKGKTLRILAFGKTDDVIENTVIE